ncbi:MAG: hypothetical protein ABGW78_07770, partial [Pirellulales bacterium]
GNCKRRSVKTRSSAQDRVVIGEVGKTVNTLPAQRPLWERNKAMEPGRLQRWPNNALRANSSRAPAA